MVSINQTTGDVDDDDDHHTETMNYLSLAGMAPEDEYYPVDRSRSIFELIDERKSND